MLNSIMGCSQEIAYMIDLDLTDILLLYYVMIACGSPDMYHIVVESDYEDESNIVLTWLSHKKIIEDLPILRLSEPTIRNRILNLKNSGFIVSRTVHNKKGRGTRTYYGLSNSALNLFKRPNQSEQSEKNKDVTMSLENDIVTTTTSLENDIKTRPRHFKMTSDNKLNIDKELNIDKRLDDAETASNTSQSKLNSIDKPKKLNVYDKCVLAIQDEKYRFTDTVKEKLTEYLPIRMNKTTVPFKVDNWYSILKKLTQLSKDEDIQIKIIQKSIDEKWASFFELKENNYNKRERVFSEYNTSSEHVTQEEMANGHFSTDKY